MFYASEFETVTMIRIKVIKDIRECRNLWERLIPQELISDLWDVRYCFHEQYNCPPHFLVAEEGEDIVGFLPLSLNMETGKYNYFPGETWEGKTWLEQNRIIAKDKHVLHAMLSKLDKPYNLRYLRSNTNWEEDAQNIDELGYLFLPELYEYDMERYYEQFSHKTARKLKKELERWNGREIEWRYDRFEDFEILSRMNLERYGESSYFHDERFLNSFHSLISFLNDHNWLRMVTVIVDGKPAAVDMGSLYNGMLTMLAGGTNADFPGIAKLINIHHMTYACENKLDSVDFLCGDFNWKSLFHLTPSPLYLLEGKDGLQTAHHVSAYNPSKRSTKNWASIGAPHV